MNTVCLPPPAGPDWWLVALCFVAFLVVVAAAIAVRAALDQDDFPDDDPHARPFADSEGGPGRG